MDIEKSIGILKVFRNYNKFYKEENKNLTITITLETKESIDIAIERLLTAYEKEKEKNKELNALRLKEINNTKYWVHKDKIKAKIEPRLKELDGQMKKEWKEYGNSREYQDMEDEWNFLQSLLEKE